MIKLNIDLRTRQWTEFQQESKPFSIALDGYVHGGPKFDLDGPRVNFNHHEDVDRLATRATCAQVLMAIRQGLFSTFRNKDGPIAHVMANDCDEDVCTSWTLLRHHYLVQGALNPAINRLVAMEDALDATAGAYPFPKDLPALRELAWIFEPYRMFRLSGQIYKRNPDEFKSIIQDVELRIMLHITGRGQEVPLDTRYEILGGDSKCTVVREIGAQSRTGMFSDGIRVFVSVKERPDGRYAYVIGKMSPFR